MGTQHRLHFAGDRPVSDAERVIRTLHGITISHGVGFAEQVRQVLQLGCARFGLEVGILAHVEQGRYRVVQAVAPADVSVGPGDTFELANTFCELTLAADGPVGFICASRDDELQLHPAFRSFGLEAYIGVPVRAGERVFGTLNFSSASRRPEHFLDVDVDALHLMAEWLGSEIERRNLADEVQRLEGLIPICASCKQIRNELGDWTQLEEYLASRIDARFSHGICPGCAVRLYGADHR